MEELKEQALNGDRESQYELGNLYAKGIDGNAADLEQAAHWYEKAAEQSHLEAMCNFAFLTYTGNGVIQDEAKAVALFEEAAEKGQPQAQLNLGILESQKPAGNIDVVVDWYVKSAQNGNAEAAYNLGVLFFEGTKVSPDPERAFRYFTQSAEHGNRDSEYSVGYCFSKGIGIEKSVEQAVQFYERAAQKGHASAQYNLGLHYEYGMGVEAEDKEEALFWYQKASNQGHDRATQAIELLENQETETSSETPESMSSQ